VNTEAERQRWYREDQRRSRERDAEPTKGSWRANQDSRGASQELHSALES